MKAERQVEILTNSVYKLIRSRNADSASSSLPDLRLPGHRPVSDMPGPPGPRQAERRRSRLLQRPLATLPRPAAPTAPALRRLRPGRAHDAGHGRGPRRARARAGRPAVPGLRPGPEPLSRPPFPEDCAGRFRVCEEELMTIPCVSCGQETDLDELQSVPIGYVGDVHVSRGQLCPACAASLRAAPSFGSWLDLMDALRIPPGIATSRAH